MEVLAEADWLPRRGAHEARVDRYLRPHLARREAGGTHPVHDFLFTYYAQRPAALRRWHPGFGVALSGDAAAAYAAYRGYGQVGERSGEGARVGPAGSADDRVVCPTTCSGPSSGTRPVTVTAAYVGSQRPLVRRLRGLLAATAARGGHFGCFGLHEWAMVYRSAAGEVRHPQLPLRLGSEGTDRVVDQHRVACSHFDAYRFFTPAARPRNTLRPGPDDRAELEQPGCLHANMDLYKHAYRLSPMVGSDLVADCFELAWEVRVLDMRASPYDLSGLGLDPVPVETAPGRAAYVAAQRAFADRAQVLRARLVAECDRLLALGGPPRFG